MSGILFISDSRESLPIAWRIAQEGLVNVYYYTHDKNYRNNFSGILPQISMGEITRTLKKVDTVFFDITLPNRKPPHPHDVQLLKLFGCRSNVPGVFGVIADKLMDTHHVIGSSSFCEKIELDREAGFKMAKKLGFEIPEYQKFKGLNEGIKFLQSNEGIKEKWVLKLLGNGPLDLTYCDTFNGEILDLMISSLPLRLKKEKFNPDKVEYILQRFVDGVECSNELWWNGKEFTTANRTIECKHLGSSNTGPATGSQSNSVSICYDMDGPVFDLLKNVEPYLKRSGYEGPLDANVIFGSEPPHKPYWLEATWRCGWSALYCLCKFIPEGNLTSFFLNGFNVTLNDGYVASQLLSLYPYPDLTQQRLGMMIENNLINHKLNDNDLWYQDVHQDNNGNLRCSGADGIIGVITCLEESPEKAIEKVQSKCKKFEVTGNRQYRDDHLTKHMKRINKLRSWNIEF